MQENIDNRKFPGFNCPVHYALKKEEEEHCPVQWKQTIIVVLCYKQKNQIKPTIQKLWETSLIMMIFRLKN